MNSDQQSPGLVIFDCDGVLIDSEIISATILMELLAHYGLTVDLQHVQRHFLGRSFPTVAASIRTSFDLDLPATFESDYRRMLLLCFEKELQPSAGILDVLETLQTPFCVATSSSPERVKRSLKIVGLDRFFEGNTYTASQVARGKPAPDLFLHVAETEGCAPHRCLVIEDSLPGIEAARSAGMRVLQYVGGSHFKDTQQSMERPSGADGVFDSWDRFCDLAPGLVWRQTLRRQRGR
ncbi:MAG: HAD family hydrolase [Pseudomonadota bacterium]